MNNQFVDKVTLNIPEDINVENKANILIQNEINQPAQLSEEDVLHASVDTTMDHGTTLQCPSLREYTKEYIKSGFALIPIPSGTKGPKLKGWNNPDNAIHELTGISLITGNVGLCHAYSSPVTCALDIDDLAKSAIYLLRYGINLNDLLNADDAVQIISGKENRAKLLYKLPDSEKPFPTIQISENSGMLFELRCATRGGKTMQDVLPPSIHPETGKEYKWGGKGNFQKLPILPNSLLIIWKEKQTHHDKGVIDEVNDLARLAAQPQETAESIAKLKSALASISANHPYEHWIRLVFSVKAHGFSEGKEICREWCKTAGVYDHDTNPGGYDESAFERVWRTDVRGISASTLYYHSAHKVQYTTGDIKAGEVFAELFRGKMKYVYPIGKWLIWTGVRWRLDKGHEALTAGKKAANELGLRAKKESNNVSDKLGNRLIAQASSYSNHGKIETMLVCAAAEPEMYVDSAEMLDRNKYHLGCENGVVDLVSGLLLKSTPEQLITKSTGIHFDPEATCPVWERFLLEIMVNDPKMVEYLQRAIGYSITGDVSEEVLHFAYGTGRNGKSVFANILTKLMGDYVLTAPAEMLMKRDRGSSAANNDVARLLGIRLLMANETRADQALDDLTLKTLVSSERISARFLYKEFFDFWPTHKIWVRGNHKPIVQDESDGAWRRLRLLDFALQLNEWEVNPDLQNSLEKELPGILAWAVRGCLIWKMKGLFPPEKVEVASNAYRRDSDIFADFLDDCCILGVDEKVEQYHLYNTYKNWCFENGYKSFSKKSFTRRLQMNGIKHDVYMRKDRAYGGIRLKCSFSDLDEWVSF